VVFSVAQIEPFMFGSHVYTIPFGVVAAGAIAEPTEEGSARRDAIPRTGCANAGTVVSRAWPVWNASGKPSGCNGSEGDCAPMCTGREKERRAAREHSVRLGKTNCFIVLDKTNFP
jgi:hypothetical protein